MLQFKTPRTELCTFTDLDQAPIKHKTEELVLPGEPQHNTRGLQCRSGFAISFTGAIFSSLAFQTNEQFTLQMSQVTKEINTKEELKWV